MWSPSAQLIFQVFISLLGVLLYVVEIYTQPMALFVFETGLSVFFAIDYIIFFYIAKDKYATAAAAAASIRDAAASAAMMLIATSTRCLLNRPPNQSPC